MDDFYKENGYIIREVPGLSSRLAYIRLEIVELFVNQIELNIPKEDQVYSFEENMIKLFKVNPTAYINTAKAAQNLISVSRLMTDESILGIVQAECGVSTPIINTHAVLFLNNKNTAKREANWRTKSHQDHGSTAGSHNSVVCWAPIQDMIPELGRLEIIPGSHLKGAQWSYIDEDGFARVDCYKESDFVPLDLKLGEVVIFSTLLVHRSGTNSTDTRMRWSLSYRYTDADCPYWKEAGYYNSYKYYPVQDGLSVPTEEEVRKVFG